MVKLVGGWQPNQVITHYPKRRLIRAVDWLLVGEYLNTACIMATQPTVAHEY